MFTPPPTRAEVTEYIWVTWFKQVQLKLTELTTFFSKAGAPTATDIPAGTWAIYKDTTGGTLKIYANDGGTIKSVTLT
jgi:hypothetical protein